MHGVSLAKVMHEVGQTVGGYYNHFPSRQALVVEAFELAMNEEVQRWQRLCEKAGRQLATREIAAQYLSQEHRDHPGSGCPLPAFAADFGREAPEVRKVFAGKLEEMLRSLAAHGNSKRSRQHATAMIATMLGAMVLARACAGSDLSDEILELTRQHLQEHGDTAEREPGLR